MATDPAFASTVKTGAVTVPATADTSLTAPTNTATVLSAGASGSKVEQLRITQIATTSAAGLLNIFLHDGSTYRLLDQYAYAALTLSTTVGLTPVDLYYTNLVLPAGWSIRVSVTTTAGQSALSVSGFGGDY